MTAIPPAEPERKPYVSPSPSQEDVDQVSRDQALIADEWASTETDPGGPKKDKPG